MGALRDGRVLLELDKAYPMLANLNAIEELQTTYGSLEDMIGLLYDGEKCYCALRHIVTVLANEGREEDTPQIDLYVMGRLLHTKNFVYARDKVIESILVASEGDKEKNEDGEEALPKNV